VVIRAKSYSFVSASGYRRGLRIGLVQLWLSLAKATSAEPLEVSILELIILWRTSAILHRSSKISSICCSQWQRSDADRYNSLDLTTNAILHSTEVAV
jgi:hypothetical protein